ncbi:MAG: ABC transporter ATP-binding protein [Gemmatimonadaceae bacterium]|nr:ABC transporter ATP-binding protein [Gemmatimonadaceae bacterium]
MTTTETLVDGQARAHDSGAPSALVVSEIHKRFPSYRTLWQTLRHPTHREWVESLRGVSFSVPRGEFFGILGPNGAGKTTLFKCITGLVTAEGGRIQLQGFDVARETRKARAQVGVVFANERAMNWRLNARENLRLFAALYDVPRGEVEDRIDSVLRLVDLADTGQRLLGTFSSGMKQRLSLARALMTDPPILLLDEPTRSLDPVSAQRFRDFVREQVVTRDRTVVLATHMAEEAFGLCDRVLVLDRGRVLAIDTAARLADQFADHVYRAWVRDAGHPSLRRSGARLLDELATHDGWSVVEFPDLGTANEASETLRRLVADGVVVSRFERMGLSLGELLERVVAQRGGDP